MQSNDWARTHKGLKGGGGGLLAPCVKRRCTEEKLKKEKICTNTN